MGRQTDIRCTNSDPADEQSIMRKLVRSNNFTQQTNALDVDKHMWVWRVHMSCSTLTTLV